MIDCVIKDSEAAISIRCYWSNVKSEKIASEIHFIGSVFIGSSVRRFIGFSKKIPCLD